MTTAPARSASMASTASSSSVGWLTYAPSPGSAPSGTHHCRNSPSTWSIRRPPPCAMAARIVSMNGR